MLEGKSLIVRERRKLAQTSLPPTKKVSMFIFLIRPRKAPCDYYSSRYVFLCSTRTEKVNYFYQKVKIKKSPKIKQKVLLY